MAGIAIMLSAICMNATCGDNMTKPIKDGLQLNGANDIYKTVTIGADNQHSYYDKCMRCFKYTYVFGLLLLCFFALTFRTRNSTLDLRNNCHLLIEWIHFSMNTHFNSCHSERYFFSTKIHSKPNFFVQWKRRYLYFFDLISEWIMA